MYKTLIAEAEEIWMDSILEFTKEHFSGNWMPSHDLEHHKRVWKNACTISLHSKTGGRYFYQELILACFFHDLGLVYDKSDKHGKKSRELCDSFLSQHPEKLVFDTQVLFEAIEFHDDKEYKVQLDHNPVYCYLSISDDMDAFGALGVYRYIEIYIIRGLNPDDIPELVLKNAKGRLEKLMSLSETLSIQAKEIGERFRTLEEILKEEVFVESPLSLVLWLQKKIVSMRIDPYDFFINYKDVIDNKRIEYFISQISMELN